MAVPSVGHHLDISILIPLFGDASGATGGPVGRDAGIRALLGALSLETSAWRPEVGRRP